MVMQVQPLIYNKEDPRPIVLFEMSGVLCNSARDRQASIAKNHLPRPGLRHLARLLPRFRLGIYTTAQVSTRSINAVLDTRACAWCGNCGACIWRMVGCVYMKYHKEIVTRKQAIKVICMKATTTTKSHYSKGMRFP